ncbi:NAD(P)H-binding protein [Nonomuraea sp. NPDC049419]|uniref:NAD(P)H-binding protein n=1 Tax=Nonomuraea sp. NPDC049419 TaxID=3155772 RepID=UPI00341FC494
MYVITGATGNVGAEVVRLLAAAGEQITAVSRNPAPQPAGVRHVAADLGDPGSLKAAFAGASTSFLLVAGQEPEAVLKTAQSAGIRRVVLLSSQGAGTRPGLYAHPAAFEAAVRASGLEWTILRPGGFFTNTLAWAGSVREGRTAAAPFADTALPFIDPADIAEVAAMVLRQDGHAGRTYVLTGPEPISPRERAAALRRALGTEVRFIEQSRDEAHAEMARFMPLEAVEATLSVLGTPTAAEQQVSPDVATILGRAPRTFADWVARHAAAFRP